jgi:hypothetical protein
MSVPIVVVIEQTEDHFVVSDNGGAYDMREYDPEYYDTYEEAEEDADDRKVEYERLGANVSIDNQVPGKN